jgi:hypothetical protein
LRLFAPETLDQVYGNMLIHLLHGDFTVDRSAIQSEAFTRDGHTYAYFGVAPAVLRLLAMPFTDPQTAHIARLSCLAAVVIFVFTQFRILFIIDAGLRSEDRSNKLFLALLATTALSGPQIFLLSSASIFHEAIFWSAALAALFNLIVVRAVFVKPDLENRDILWLAILSGIALNTRASVGVGLCVAFTALVLWTAWYRYAAADHARSGRTGIAALTRRSVTDRGLVSAVLLLAVFVVLVGWINYGRWGSPFKFADFRYYDFAHRQPDRLVDILKYGELNPNRILASLLYYTTGLPYLVKNIAPFADYFRTHFDGVQAPPSSGVFTNPLIVILAAAGVWQLWRKPGIAFNGRMLLSLTLAGQFLIMLLLFSAMYLALRYRFDFAPFMSLAAALGYRSFSQSLSNRSARQRAFVGNAAIVATVVGVICSHYVLIMYKTMTVEAMPEYVRPWLLHLAPFAYVPR